MTTYVKTKSNWFENYTDANLPSSEDIAVVVLDGLHGPLSHRIGTAAGHLSRAHPIPLQQTQQSISSMVAELGSEKNSRHTV